MVSGLDVTFATVQRFSGISMRTDENEMAPVPLAGLAALPFNLW